jgi:ubiquinone/menaquinone biosynthesis C-methylase UbiE/catechol 2,3-dioxygenase-like lactoylglutathione lyase family enzyme
MFIKRIHHINITIPLRAEDAARRFYCELLGLPETPKPESLKMRGGLWLQVGEREVHLGTEDGIDRHATKAHIAYQVDDLQAWRERLADHNVEVGESIPIPGYDRFEFRDPFGNRVEIIAPTTAPDSKQLSRQRYTQFAEGYITSETHATGTDLDRLVEIARPQATWHVLDVATGGGHTALKFAPHVAQVTATDLTPRMLQKAERFIQAQGVENIRYQQADAESLPFDAGMFDLVTCRIAPHHFPDPFKFVQEAIRVLKPGGLLLVQDHVLPDDPHTADYVDAFEKLRDPSHNRAYAEYEWRGMFLDTGLTVEHTEQLTKRHAFVDWAGRQGCDDATVARLTVLLARAPAPAGDWMQPHAVGTPEASFVNHHLIIAGRKDE